MKEKKVALASMDSKWTEYNAEEVKKMQEWQYKKYLENQKQRKRRQSEIRREMEKEKEKEKQPLKRLNSPGTVAPMNSNDYISNQLEVNVNTNQCSEIYLRYVQKLKDIQQKRLQQMSKNEKSTPNATKNAQSNKMMECHLKCNHNHNNTEQRRQAILDQKRAKAMVSYKKMIEKRSEKARLEQEKKKQLMKDSGKELNKEKEQKKKK